MRILDLCWLNYCHVHYLIFEHMMMQTAYVFLSLVFQVNISLKEDLR